MERSQQPEGHRAQAGEVAKGLWEDGCGQIDLSTKPDAVLFFIRTFGVKKEGVLSFVYTLFIPSKTNAVENQFIKINILYPRRESNPYLKFRKLPFYPLNYRGG